MNKQILIVGGYGAVGSIITEKLAIKYPNKVIVAGRNFKKAEELAIRLNQTVTPYKLDISKNTDNTNLLNNVGLVVMCIDQVDTNFIKTCIDKGINYIDITANQNLIEKIEQLNTKAKQNNASVVISVGLAPGITNLLTQHSINTSAKSQLIDIYILLGLGEKHGDSAYKWTFNNLNTEYHISKNNKTITVKSFTQPKYTELYKKQNFYLFNFSDQHSLVKTTPVNQVITRMAFDSILFTKTIYILRKIGFTKIFQNEWIQNRLIYLFNKINIGSDVYAVKIENSTIDGKKFECSVQGNGEGKITAYVAVEAANLLIEQSAPKGVFHINQVVKSIPQFLEKLKKHDSKIEIKI